MICLQSPDASITRIHIASHYSKFDVGSLGAITRNAQTFCGVTVSGWNEVEPPSDVETVCSVCRERVIFGRGDR